MRISIYLILILSGLILGSCNLFKKGVKIDTYIEIETTEGSFIVGLYEKTPIHSNQFKNLCEDGVYDSLLIHQIGPDGIIIAGDTESKNANINYSFSNYGVDTSLKLETFPDLLHTRGKIGAWRVTDDNNPEKFSHSTIFYMIYGLKFTEKDLKLLETVKNRDKTIEYMKEYLKKEENKELKDSMDYYLTHRMNKDYERLFVETRDIIVPIMEKDGVDIFKLSDKQKEIYAETPGIPYMDGKYSIFGEIVEGIDILEKLSKQRIRIKNRPQKDIYILKTRILSDEEWKEIKKRLKKQRKS
jgi:peptidylprolyl isomerase